MWKKLRCKLGWHYGDWVFKPDRLEKLPGITRVRTVGSCVLVRNCVLCGTKSSKFQHDVEHWESNGLFSIKESGRCARRTQIITKNNFDQLSSG